MEAPDHHHPSLRAFVLARNGVPLGHPDSLRQMLERSLGASSFRGFWRFWNPIWGYALGRWIYGPATLVMPRSLALVLTFAISGALHDLAIGLLRGGATGFLALGFSWLGLGVLIGDALRMDLGRLPWAARAAVHLSAVAGCIGTARWLLG